MRSRTVGSSAARALGAAVALRQARAAGPSPCGGSKPVPVRDPLLYLPHTRWYHSQGCKLAASGKGLEPRPMLRARRRVPRRAAAGLGRAAQHGDAEARAAGGAAGGGD